MRDRAFLIACAVCHALTIGGEILWMILYPWRLQWEILQWYTYLSNFLCLGVSLVFLPLVIREIRGKKPVPQVLRTLRWICCTGMCLTFLTVCFVLAPAAGPDGYKDLMFSGPLFFVHTLCPVLTLVSFCVFERPCVPKGSPWYRGLAIATAPTAAYILVSGFLNLIRVWHGPYPFLYVWEQPVWASVLWLGFFVLAGAGTALGLRALSGLHKDTGKR